MSPGKKGTAFQKYHSFHWGEDSPLDSFFSFFLFFSCFTSNLTEGSCSLFALGRFGYRGLHHSSSPLTPINHHCNGHRHRHSRQLLDTVPHQTALHRRRQLTLCTLNHPLQLSCVRHPPICYANDATTTSIATTATISTQTTNQEKSPFTLTTSTCAFSPSKFQPNSSTASY